MTGRARLAAALTAAGLLAAGAGPAAADPKPPVQPALISYLTSGLIRSYLWKNGATCGSGQVLFQSWSYYDSGTGRVKFVKDELIDNSGSTVDVTTNRLSTGATVVEHYPGGGVANGNTGVYLTAGSSWWSAAWVQMTVTKRSDTGCQAKYNVPLPRAVQ